MNNRASSKPKSRGLSKPPTPPEARYKAWIWVGVDESHEQCFADVAAAKRWIIPQLNNELPTIEDEWGIMDRWTGQLVLASAGVQRRAEERAEREEEDARS